jgi:hypothetical protein
VIGCNQPAENRGGSGRSGGSVAPLLRYHRCFALNECNGSAVRHVWMFEFCLGVSGL